MEINYTHYDLSYRDVYKLLSLLKEYYSLDSAAFDEEDAKLLIDLQVAMDKYEAAMAYTE